MSWNKSTNCCNWDGVTCDKVTSNDIELDISCSELDGSIDSSSRLFRDSHLRRLNIALNYLIGQIPSELLKLTELTTLSLSDNTFIVEPDILKLLM
ncbi:hypothetical protein LIER_42771 [Lithospermum erythrorhizon]|uniref:Leucine-rich repeat-containing N-terminal plant-type domain-containing protein n=1 Tax=Lithospermum erythrorhizon TaxID=34254 RepID=A0AAV3NXE6_LITER